MLFFLVSAPEETVRALPLVAGRQADNLPGQKKGVVPQLTWNHCLSLHQHITVARSSYRFL